MGGCCDVVAWLMGFENMIVLTAEQPDFMHALLEIVAQWNRRRLEVLLEAGIDLYLKRIFYECTDFWSPRLYREFLQPILKADVELAHQAGVKVGGMMTTGTLPLVDALVEAGLDVLIGIDPLVTGLTAIKDKTRGRIALWGGVNGYRTVEQDSEAKVRMEVAQAMEKLSPAADLSFRLWRMCATRRNGPGTTSWPWWMNGEISPGEEVNDKHTERALG